MPVFKYILIISKLRKNDCTQVTIIVYLKMCILNLTKMLTVFKTLKEWERGKKVGWAVKPSRTY